MSSESDAIAAIAKSANTDAEALVTLFSSSSIPGDASAAGRLRAILKGTEKFGVPGLQTGVEFHDTGFRREFRDPWPKSDNQLGPTPSPHRSHAGSCPPRWCRRRAPLR